jgi:hypothetical protein
MLPADMHFPVLCISKNGYLNAARTFDELTTCRKLGLQKGYFNDLTIIDSVGQSWTVSSAKKSGNVGRFGGWTLLGARRIRVDLEVSAGPLLDLNSFKTMLCRSVAISYPRWDGVGPTRELISKINNADCNQHVIEMFVGNAGKN